MGTVVLKYYSSDEITCIVGAGVKRLVHTPPSVFWHCRHVPFGAMNVLSTQ